MNYQSIKTVAIAFFLAILFCFFRFFTHPLGLNNYGYDYGFYSYAIKHTNLHSLSYLLGQVNDYGNHLHVIFNILKLPQLPSLEISFYIFGVITVFLLFLYLSQKSVWAGFIGSMWFIFSVAQTQVFTMFLWKTSYGILLLLLLFLFLELKKYRLTAITVVLMLISHKTTVLAALIPSALYSISNFIKQKNTLIYLLLGILVFGLVYLMPLGGWNDFIELQKSVAKDGIFMSFKTYLLFSWYLWPFAIYEIFLSIKNRSLSLWVWLFGVSLVWVIFGLTLWQRMLVYLDLALIIIASLAVAKLLSKLPNKYFRAGIAIMLCGVSLWQYQAWIPTITPQISEEQITEIKEFSKNNQGVFVLALGAKDAPWLLANLSGNIRLGAPGLFEDFQTEYQWKSFWINPEDYNFFRKFPKPLYLYQNDNLIYRSEWECLEKISNHFFKFTCH